MYPNFYLPNLRILRIALLSAPVLIPAFIGVQADNYQPMPGSFRPPSLGDSRTSQSGFRQGSIPVTPAPSQQPLWTSKPYGSSPNYYLPLPAPQPVPQYQQQNDSNNWQRSFNVNPGNVMNQMFGFNNADNQTQSNYQPPVYQPPVYQPLGYQPPAYQAPIQQAPAYPNQQYYGSSYLQQYNYSSPQIQQQPAAIPSQPAPQATPYRPRPFGGQNTRFRPPELKGTD